MNAVLLSLHVLTVIVLVGPITVATSLFPRYARGSLVPGSAGLRAQGVVIALHRITRGYAFVALLVPALGLATAVGMRVLGQAWLLVSIAITLLAAGILGLAVLPAQRRLMAVIGDVDPLAAPPDERVVDRARAASRRLAGTTGWFALAWAAVVVLMIVRPGSTTGVWR